ncbi:hypothetical protein [Segetibacter aerophilus]|nr:hypothetical protein [Segetibacter aerophilus]
MSAIQEPFYLAFGGVSTKVTPIVNGLDMMYLVELPTRSVMIQTVPDASEIDYWEEINIGRTALAEEIGRLIESRDM